MTPRPYWYEQRLLQFPKAVDAFGLMQMASRLGQCARYLALSLSVVVTTTAGPQPADALSRLKHERQIACQPSAPYFCANVHVSCSGRTTVPTFPFSLRITPTGGGALEAPPGSAVFVEQYSDAQVEWSTEGLYVIVRPARSSGYIKLFRDGKYVFRHYPQHEGVMSLGQCG